MSDEFVHIDVGEQLTKAEWEATGTHQLNDQAAGDLVHATGTTGTPLVRLPVGASGSILTVSAGLPSWNTILNGDYTVNGTLNVTGNVSGGAVTATSITGTSAYATNVSATNVTATNLNFTDATGGGIVLGAGKSIEFYPVTINGTYSGATVSVTSIAAVSAGQIGYINGSGHFAVSNATSVTSLPATHIAVADVEASALGVFMSYGYMANTGATASFSAGKEIYAATGTGFSSMSTAVPATGVSGCIQPIGRAYSSSAVFFRPDLTIIELV